MKKKFADVKPHNVALLPTVHVKLMKLPHVTTMDPVTVINPEEGKFLNTIRDYKRSHRRVQFFTAYLNIKLTVRNGFK